MISRKISYLGLPLVLLACQSHSDDHPDDTGQAHDASPSEGDDQDAVGEHERANEDAGDSDDEQRMLDACNSTSLLIERKTFAELVQEIGRLLGTLAEREAADAIPDPVLQEDSAAQYDPKSIVHLDGMAEAVSEYALTHLVELSGCVLPETGSTAEDSECARGFLLELATSAFEERTNDEARANIERVYVESLAVSQDPRVATQFGVQAILMSPVFLYRLPKQTLTRSCTDGGLL